MPDVDAIIAYEQGDLDDDAIIELFQQLVDSGLAWRLQGHYGRMAAALIEQGYVTNTFDLTFRDSLTGV